MGKISPACKAAAKKKFKVWPSAYASGWGVRCTKAGGPGKIGGGSKKRNRKSGASMGGATGIAGEKPNLLGAIKTALKLG